MKDKEIVLYAVGDVAIDRDKPESIFDLCVSTLKKADIRFCQLEEVLSEKGCPQVHHPAPLRAHPKNIAGLVVVPFDVVSFAGNHCSDYGEDALLDTISNLKQNGISVVGVGRNIDEARKPVIIEIKGIKVAFLAYNSILPPGYAADEYTAGCCPIRVFTFYEQADLGQPGTPPRVHTFPDPDDLRALKEDVQRAKRIADVVAVSMHWGIHFVPAMLARYQKEVAYAAIDAGADLILGHHAHILKGIEIYKGKAIFYSLCNFAFDFPVSHPSLTKPVTSMKAMREIHASSWIVDPDYTGYSFPPDARKTIVVKCVLSGNQIDRVSFLPTYINKEAQPEILSHKTERFKEVVTYIEKISQDQELNLKLNMDGDEAVVLG